MSVTDILKGATLARYNNTLFKIMIVVMVLVLVYFFSYQLQKKFGGYLQKFSKKIGTYSATREFKLQKYVYQHHDSLFAKYYRWLNMQIVALGLKRVGVTVFGYMFFWMLLAIILSFIFMFMFDLNVFLLILLTGVLYFCMMIVTRVLVSSKLEKREADVMDAIDLIVPEIGNGVKNAILAYKDNFPPSIRDDFIIFLANIQDRGYSFNDAMYILADAFGSVFDDFAEKAIYYEAIGEKEMVDIFSDIIEVNRLRRQLRAENAAEFAALKTTFVVSTLITTAYFGFLMLTDSFSRNLFLSGNTFGTVLLIIILLTVFLVLAYVTTIKSRQI